MAQTSWVGFELHAVPATCLRARFAPAPDAASTNAQKASKAWRGVMGCSKSERRANSLVLRKKRLDWTTTGPPGLCYAIARWNSRSSKARR